ncbi:DUF2283 domain-containing protein [Sphingobacterium faecium]|uniref:DUF2283 domain-containing protein n=1 Tax=Sphingobacterium faecium TaxID=34087 RepID=UPI0024696353|nr:DUF2283 domain-containing protein [Sphingobacterium faecium]MDH5826430.1 DUF2283 domain-containing protein [Sphingobacterium faecium]
MQYEYDSEVDGLYIWFVNNIEEEKCNYDHELWPMELKEEIGLLFGKDGGLMGLEIMPASKYFEQSRLDSFDKT